MKCGYITLLNVLLLLMTQYPLVMPRHAPHHHHQSTLEGCYKCPPGFGVVHKCNRHHDTQCRPCPEGFYSSHSSAHRPCYPCSKCGIGLYVAHRCSVTNDTVCDSCHTYRGPHNQDFHKKCVLPLSAETTTGVVQSGVDSSHEAPVMVSAGGTNGLQTYVITGAMVALAAVAATVIVSCYICTMRKYRKQVNSRYVYQAVATQEGVML